MSERRKRHEREWRPPSRAELRSLAPRPEPSGFIGVIVSVPLTDGVIGRIRQALEGQGVGGRVIYIRGSQSPLKVVPKSRGGRSPGGRR